MASISFRGHAACNRSGGMWSKEHVSDHGRSAGSTQFFAFTVQRQCLSAVSSSGTHTTASVAFQHQHGTLCGMLHTAEANPEHIQCLLPHWNSRMMLQGHRAPVLHMAVDGSGGLLASASADKSAKVWDIDGGFCTHSFTGHRSACSTLTCLIPLPPPPLGPSPPTKSLSCLVLLCLCITSPATQCV